MAVMASSNTVTGAGSLYLLVLQSSEFKAGILVSRLQKSAPAAAAVIIGTVRSHVYEIFLSDARLDHVAQILGNGVPVAFSYYLAGILCRKLDSQILVPVRAYLEPALPDPFCIIFVNILDFKLMFNVELLQSEPDCESNVPSLGI